MDLCFWQHFINLTPVHWKLVSRWICFIETSAWPSEHKDFFTTSDLSLG